MDAEKAFSSLQHSIPQWFDCLAEVADKAARLHSEMAAVPAADDAAAAQHTTESIESIQENLADVRLDQPNRLSSAAQSGTLTSRRKRRPRSAGSDQASGPSKHRWRHWVVVHYDGEVQKLFERLVRDIGSGRNLIRKAKLSAKMEALSTATASSSEDDDDDDDDADGAEHVLSSTNDPSRPALAPTRRPKRSRASRAARSAATVELLDSTDKALEHAQAQCEKGAHQSLRDGDCSKELDGVRKHLHDARRKTELETTTAAAAAAARGRPPRDDARNHQPSAVESPVSAADGDAFTKPSTVDTGLPSAPPLPPLAPKHAPIEVDPDADADEWEMPAVPPIRLMSRVKAG